MHLVFFFWCLCRFGDSDFTKHWQAPKKQKKEKNQTRCTKHRQAPKKTKNIQQLLRGGPIVPGFFFCFFLVPVQVWWLWLHKILTGTKKNKKKTTTRCTKHRQAPKKNPATTQKWIIVPGFFSVFFGACAGLVHLVVCFFFLLCLCRFGDSDFTKHWQAAKTTKKHS